MTAPVLEVRRLSHAFGGVLANRDITLGVAEGSITGLIGPNGSGKTTLFSCIAGSRNADAGEIRFRGRDLRGMPVQRVARMGLLRTFQRTHVYTSMTCMQNMRVSIAQRELRLVDRVRGYPRAVDERARELLDFVGLDAKREALAGELSFGQQKLLELAMALMSEPSMLLLDEPTAGINPTMIESVIGRLERANLERGVTLFVIEHNMHVIMTLASHIWCLAHGELLAHGPPAAIQRDSRVIDAYLGTR